MIKKDLLGTIPVMMLPVKRAYIHYIFRVTLTLVLLLVVFFFGFLKALTSVSAAFFFNAVSYLVYIQIREF